MLARSLELLLRGATVPRYYILRVPVYIPNIPRLILPPARRPPPAVLVGWTPLPPLILNYSVQKLVAHDHAHHNIISVPIVRMPTININIPITRSKQRPT